jgi:hypothetical protein
LSSNRKAGKGNGQKLSDLCRDDADAKLHKNLLGSSFIKGNTSRHEASVTLHIRKHFKFEPKM